MYTKEQLKRFDYLEKELNLVGINNMLDPLTGVLSRQYILGLAQDLIGKGTPFTFGILDLDNFKYINDTYGHHAGDGVLSGVAQRFADFLEGYGICGRFGGDEFLFIDMKNLEYAQKKEALCKAYEGGTTLRVNIKLEDCEPFTTGTIGCATFPTDAGDYNSLFGLVDKTLYRGKTKGRNCYIIYVEEKHKDIVISQMARHGVYTAMHAMVRQFEMVPGIPNKLRSVMPLLMEELQVSDLYLVNNEGKVCAVRNESVTGYAPDIGNIMTDDLYSSNEVEKLDKRCPLFHAFLMEHKLETAVVIRINMDEDTYGYMFCAEPRSRRLWQENDNAIIYFLAKMVALRLKLEGGHL
ncbi:MAG: GGDEF domain-containing protein [Lachnospiraceae bacterium]|nr:GGDEF domain-containing protein [Lachnospiraceae bacterium]